MLPACISISEYHNNYKVLFSLTPSHSWRGQGQRAQLLGQVTQSVTRIWKQKLDFTAPNHSITIPVLQQWLVFHLLLTFVHARQGPLAELLERLAELYRKKQDAWQSRMVPKRLQGPLLISSWNPWCQFRPSWHLDTRPPQSLVLHPTPRKVNAA